ncbi:sex peptide receptor [Eurytemora carolleeae]|uniref:sex peptide receptor n=1 Tax=Eurytemora carolleeae TaxID=1294199 RepID=UPI000C7607B6|nr:sex peptide receptor [Eurytemora carolleeae]|eukprot:XP_023321473.1 sex peptide receptor-like [Eurytemora affinis]
MGWTGPLCYIFEFMIDTAPQLFHSASNLLTLALAVQRYIYVCHATTAKQWCTIARSKVVICLILTLSVAHMVSRTADRNYSTIMTDGANGTAIIPVCRVEFSHWLTAAPNSLTIYFNTYFWFRVLFVQLFPCISLVILNILLFSAMRRAESRRRRLTVNRNTPKVQSAATSRRASLFGLSRENRRQRDANSTTMMLIVVIAVFLVVEIPLAVMSALHTISSSVHEFMNYELARDIVLFIDTTICLSYPVNFAIYCGMSRQFRTTFSSLILTPCIRLVKPAPSPDENIEENPERSKWNNGAGPSTKITKATVAGTTEANGLLTTNF